MDFKLQSDEIDKLTAAFVEARKSFQSVKEDNKANYGQYVSLDEIKACTNSSLLANGLSLTQTRTCDGEAVFLVTKLMHVSGQWQASYVPLIIPTNPKDINQAYGTALTYQRRYELYGMFSIKGEDLDPDSLQESKSSVQTPPKKYDPIKPDIIGMATLSKLLAVLKNQENGDEIQKTILDNNKIKRLDDLTEEKAKAYIKALDK